MKRMIVAACLAMIPGATFGQEQRVMSSRELMDATLADFRGLREQLYPTLPGMLPPQPWSPFSLWTPPPSPRPAPPAGGTISVPSLLHRVPKPAKKAYDRGIKFTSKGDPRRALEELQKALALDPEYTEAHIGLGVQYVLLDRFQEAEAEFRRSMELDPYVSIAHSNLGWVLFHRRNLPEAERHARRALALSPNNDWARALLGILLAAAPETRAEGERYIQQAGSAFPEMERVLNELRGR